MGRNGRPEHHDTEATMQHDLTTLIPADDRRPVARALAKGIDAGNKTDREVRAITRLAADLLDPEQNTTPVLAVDTAGATPPTPGSDAQNVVDGYGSVTYTDKAGDELQVSAVGEYREDRGVLALEGAYLNIGQQKELAGLLLANIAGHDGGTSGALVADEKPQPALPEPSPPRSDVRPSRGAHRDVSWHSARHLDGMYGGVTLAPTPGRTARVDVHPTDDSDATARLNADQLLQLAANAIALATRD